MPGLADSRLQSGPRPHSALGSFQPFRTIDQPLDACCRRSLLVSDTVGFSRRGSNFGFSLFSRSLLDVPLMTPKRRFSSVLFNVDEDAPDDIAGLSLYRRLVVPPRPSRWTAFGVMVRDVKPESFAILPPVPRTVSMEGRAICAALYAKKDTSPVTTDLDAEPLPRMCAAADFAA